MKPNPRGKISTKTWLITRKSRFCIKNSEKKKIVGNIFGGIEIGKTMDLLRVWNS